MRLVTCSVVVAGVVLSACRENAPVQPQQPGSIKALIVDGNHAGNANFFFLPPLVPDPSGSPNFIAAQFNPNLSPFAEVCKLADNPLLNPTTGCATGPLTFGPARMSLDATNQDYQLNWDTGASLLDPTAFYRITVRGSAQGTALGLVDVDPVLGGMKNVKTGDIVPLQDGRTLPIKVRIQNGAFGSTNTNDRVEQVVPNVIPTGTLDVTTSTGFAGARFTSGWLPPGIDQVVLIIERIPVSDGQSQTSCLQITLEELEGCYRFRTDPDLHGLGPNGTDLLFQIPVVVGVCFQIPGAAGTPNAPPFALNRREEIAGVLTGPAVELEDVAAPFLRCDGFGPTPPSIGAAIRAGRLGDIAKAGWFAVTRGIGRIVEPKALHAIDFGAGGSTSGMSRFGWARTATMTVTAGNGATGPAGSTVQAAVQVQNVHHGKTTPVVGQAVTFTVLTGGGSLVETQPVFTDGQGTATVTWQLGLGANTLQASTNFVTNSPQVITATGTPSLLVRPVTTGFASLGVTLPLTQPSGISMQSGTGIQLEVSPSTAVSWTSSDPLGTIGSVNTTGLVALVQGNADPAVAHELDVTATGSVAGTIRIGSYAFDQFPRWTTLVWRPVVGAVSYDIEIQFGNGCTPGTAICTIWTPQFGSPATAPGTTNGFVFGFVGAQPGRWRVTAHDVTGLAILTSEWVYFAYAI